MRDQRHVERAPRIVSRSSSSSQSIANCSEVAGWPTRSASMSERRAGAQPPPQPQHRSTAAGHPSNARALRRGEQPRCGVTIDGAQDLRPAHATRSQAGRCHVSCRQSLQLAPFRRENRQGSSVQITSQQPIAGWVEARIPLEDQIAITGRVNLRWVRSTATTPGARLHLSCVSQVGGGRSSRLGRVIHG